MAAKNGRRHFHCKGKRPFPTFEAAALVRKFRIAVRGYSWAACNVYRCDYCQNWHLGRPKAARGD